MKVKIKVVASTAKAISSRANTAGVLSTALIKEISTLLKSSGFVEDRLVDKEGFSFLWTTTNSNCNMSEIELIGSIQSTKSGRKTELLEHIFYRLSRFKKTTKMRELVKNKSFDFSETADPGDSDSLFEYEGFLRKLKSELQANLIVGTPLDKGTDISLLEKASNDCIAFARSQLKGAGFKLSNTLKGRRVGSLTLFEQHWNNKDGDAFILGLWGKSLRDLKLIDNIYFNPKGGSASPVRPGLSLVKFDFEEAGDTISFKNKSNFKKYDSEMQLIKKSFPDDVARAAKLRIKHPKSSDGTQAVFTAITKQLKAAGFKQTLNERPKPSGKGFMYSSKAWQHKSGAMVVMQVGCNRDDKNKAETIMSIMRSKAGASRHTSLLPMRKLKFDKADGEWVDKASQKEYIKLLKQMPKAVEKYLTQFK